jgi:hypothetical protein
MKANRPAGLSYDIERMQLDMVAKGLNPNTLAKRCLHPETARPISRMTVSRFFDATVQTAATAVAIARALGHVDASPYMRTTRDAVAA